MDAPLPKLDPMVTELVEKARTAAFWDGIAAWGYAAYFVLFVLGGAALLLYALLPRDSAHGLIGKLALRRRQIGLWGAILLLALLAISQQRAIDDKRGFIADEERRYEAAIRKLSKRKDKEEVLRAQYMYMPREDSLKYVSLGNTSLAADFVWLTSLQYVSSAFRRGHKFEMLSRFYNTMLELDPHWSEAAINAGKILSALEQDRFLVEDFYANAVTRNPDDVRLFYEAGRLFVVPPLNKKLQKEYSKRAVAWFERALVKLKQKKNAGDHRKQIDEIEDMIARLGLESDYYLLADELLLKHASDPDSPEAMRLASAREWLGAHSQVVANRLQSLVQQFKTARGAFPPSLEALLEALPDGGRALRSDPFGFPNDAYGMPLEYDATTGIVTSRGYNARRALQVASVINSLLGLYQGTHEGRSPENLAELTRFVRKYYSDPNNSPSPVVTEAIGDELDCELSPLGAWDYDSQAGKVKLPPYCEVNTLFRNASKVLELHSPK